MGKVIALFIGRCAKHLVDEDRAESLEEVKYKLIVLKLNLIEYSLFNILSIDNFCCARRKEKFGWQHLLTLKSKKNAIFNTNLGHFNEFKNIDNPALVNLFFHIPISDPRTG